MKLGGFVLIGFGVLVIYWTLNKGAVGTGGGVTTTPNPNTPAQAEGQA